MTNISKNNRMKVEFTKHQKDMLYGHVQDIALRCGCSKDYVYRILNGNRNVNSPLSRSVLKSAKEIIKFKKSFAKAS